MNAGVLIADISDHLPIFYLSSFRKLSCYQDTIIVKKRVVNDHALTKFTLALSRCNWDHIIDSDFSDTAYNDFVHKFMIHYNEAFPYVSTKNERTHHRVSHGSQKQLGSQERKKRKMVFITRVLKNNDQINTQIKTI
jgi:hypothetical protein